MHNKQCEFDIFHLTDSSWTDDETEKFEKLSERFGSRFHVQVVDSSLMAGFPKLPRLTLPTYFRLLAPSILPATVHKVLYLDADMIVNGDIRPLWNQDLDGLAIAGVSDWAFYRHDNYDRLCYGREWGYYNAGVTLFNIDYWRENNLSERVMKWIVENHDRILWMDQDAINAVAHDKRLDLPLTYNFQAFFLFEEGWSFYDESMKKFIKKTYRHPVIIHFNGQRKPWTLDYEGYPFGTYWVYYRKRLMEGIAFFSVLRAKCRMKIWLKSKSRTAKRNKEVVAEFRDAI